MIDLVFDGFLAFSVIATMMFGAILFFKKTFPSEGQLINSQQVDQSTQVLTKKERAI